MGWTPPHDNGINVPEWKCHEPLEPEGASTTITTIGLDLALFQVHGVNEYGKAYFASSLDASRLRHSLRT
jgi:transposase